MSKIPFPKQYQSPSQLVTLLKSRGLFICDEKRAEEYMRNVGYYRLSAYLYPLLSSPKENAIPPIKPRKISRKWISSSVSGTRIFYDFCIVKWFIDIFSPNNDMKQHLKDLLAKYSNVDIRAMGFLIGWQQEPL